MATEKVLGFRIEVKGTDQETKKLASLTGELERLRASRKKLNETRKKEGRLTKAQVKELSDIELQLKANTKARNDLQKQMQINAGTIKKSTGIFGGFKKALTSTTLSMLGWGAAVFGAIRIMKGAFKIFVDFEKANSKLEAITKANTKQMKAMGDQAKELGSVTAFTATQVTELQIEFAKLGFPTNDIINMTESTLNAAAALGSELGEQAALTGAVLKQYGLDSTESARVNDVLAASASKSALDFSKLATALPIVGATAAAAGVDIERTTALLGTLSDRGIDASTAATSLRNVFLTLSEKGLTFEQAMSKINNAVDRNAASFDLFGKRGATAGVILADTGASARDLEDALNGANGAAKEMADTMLDNLSGDITKAKSAWEGFVLSLEDGSSVVGNSLRGLVQGFTNAIQGLQTLGTTFQLLTGDIKELNDSGKKDLLQFGEFANGIKLTALTEQFDNIPFDKLKNNINEMQKKFTDFVVKQGDSVKDANQLWTVYVENRINDNKKGADSFIKSENEKLEAEVAAAAAASLARKEANDKAEKERKRKKEQAKKEAEKAAIEAIKLEEKLQKDLRKLRIQNELEGRDEAAALLALSFDEKIATITGQTATEIQVRKELEEQKRQALLEQQKEFDLEDEEKQKEKDLKERDRIRDNELFKENIAREALDTASRISDVLASNELNAFDRRAKNQLDTFKGTEEEKQALAEKLDDERYKIEKRAFDRKKVLDVAQVGIDLARELSAISANAAANPANAFTFGGAGVSQAAVLSALAIGKSAANAALITSQKYQDGGYVEGASHDQGGIQMYHKGGQHIGEMEGNEYIMSSKTVDRIGVDKLDALNFGGKAINGYFANGGSVPSTVGLTSSSINPSGVLDMNSLAELLTQKMQETVMSIKVVNNAVETAQVASDVINTESELSFG